MLIEEKEKIEKLKNEIREKDKKIEELQMKLSEYKGRIDELREEKKRLNKRLNEFEVLRLDLKLKNIQSLEDENNRLKHRAEITKKLLDEAREKIEILEEIIKDFKNQKLIDRIAKKEPETLIYYKKRFK